MGLPNFIQSLSLDYEISENIYESKRETVLCFNVVHKRLEIL